MPMGGGGDKQWQPGEISRTNRRKGRERKGMLSFSPPPLPLLLHLSSLWPFTLESTARGAFGGYMDDDTANGQTLPCLAALTLAAYSLAALSFFLVSEIRQRRTHGDAAPRGRVVLDAHSLLLSSSPHFGWICDCLRHSLLSARTAMLVGGGVGVSLQFCRTFNRMRQNDAFTRIE